MFFIINGKFADSKLEQNFVLVQKLVLKTFN